MQLFDRQYFIISAIILGLAIAAFMSLHSTLDQESVKCFNEETGLSEPCDRLAHKINFQFLTIVVVIQILFSLGYGVVAKYRKENS